MRAGAGGKNIRPGTDLLAAIANGRGQWRSVHADHWGTRVRELSTGIAGRAPGRRRCVAAVRRFGCGYFPAAGIFAGIRCSTTETAIAHALGLDDGNRGERDNGTAHVVFLRS